MGASGSIPERVEMSDFHFGAETSIGQVFPYLDMLQAYLGVLCMDVSSIEKEKSYSRPNI